MKTYTEAAGYLPINWKKTLEDIISGRGQIDIDSNAFDTLVIHAGKWVTCACGNLCDIIPRDTFGAPYDSKLATLGVLFWDNIAAAAWIDALSILDRIEQRSEFLIEVELMKNGNYEI